MSMLYFEILGEIRYINSPYSPLRSATCLRNTFLPDVDSIGLRHIRRPLKRYAPCWFLCPQPCFREDLPRKANAKGARIEAKRFA